MISYGFFSRIILNTGCEFEISKRIMNRQNEKKNSQAEEFIHN